MGHLLLAAIQLLVVAQATQATIVGTVRDAANGRPVAGAVVMLTDLGRAAPTDSTGHYELPLVPAGPQHLVVRGLGYRPSQIDSIAALPEDGRVLVSLVWRGERHGGSA